MKEQWYQMKVKNHYLYAVKTKRIQPDKWLFLHLSSDDPEGMAFEEVKDGEMTIGDGSVAIHGAGVYHFGGSEGEDTIYDEDAGLNEEKMKRFILESYENRTFNMVTSEELDQVWRSLRDDKKLAFETLVID